jgi:hypothetical protein
MEWQRTFELRAPIGRVWAAFLETPPSLTWNGMVPIAALDPLQSITWTDRDDDIDVDLEMRITFAETDTGTRLTVTRSGFGDGDMFEVRQTSKLVAWGEAMHDLAVYLETGVDLGRLHRSHPDHPLSATGAQLREVLGGLLVTATKPGSFAALAGLEVGDLVVRLAGVPVFDRGDLWLLARLTAPSTPTTVQFVRGSELREASAPMSSIDLWATGELGGGPRE